MALKELKAIMEENRDYKLETIDILAQPKVAFKAGIKMIPTIEAGGRKLSGIILKKEQIEQFLRESADAK